MNSAKEVESPCCKYQTHLIIDDLKVHTVKVSTHTQDMCRFGCMKDTCKSRNVKKEYHGRIMSSNAEMQ